MTHTYIWKKWGWSFKLRCVFWIYLHVRKYLKATLFVIIRLSFFNIKASQSCLNVNTRLIFTISCPSRVLMKHKSIYGYMIYFKSFWHSQNGRKFSPCGKWARTNYITNACRAQSAYLAWYMAFFLFEILDQWIYSYKVNVKEANKNIYLKLLMKKHLKSLLLFRKQKQLLILR